MGGRDEQDKYIIRSEGGIGDTFEQVISRRLSRRDFLRNISIASTVMIAATTVGLEEAAAATPAGPAFSKIEPTTPDVDDIVVAPGYFAATLIRWGEPLTNDAPEFDVWSQSPEAQAGQFGYNCDFVGYLPLPLGSTTSTRGILAVNHEYTNEELMFPNYNSKSPSQTQVDIALQAHGMSIVEIAKGKDGRWGYVRGSRYNRRLTATTPMRISGPAAGHEWLKTSADPEGRTVLGTLNNCAGGKTPWGTVVTAEENFHQYFAHLKYLPSNDPRKAIHTRYGMPAEASERGWELYHSRFDASREPNEPFRHGWCVEVDPYDPSALPVKRTALGRFRHEAATFVVAPSGQVVAYSGDDAQFEYVYKFVTAGRYNARNRQANMKLLDEGTLYVARYNDDGSGEWLPLVFGQGPLTPENGFASQGDVLIKTRLAADALGATKMDRPEDIETNPVSKKVYVVLTNNTNRGAPNRAGTDAANPRSRNTAGHIIEMIEDGNNHAATRFTWSIFLLAGRPDEPSTYFAGYDKAQVSPIGAPDNIVFDSDGTMWVATDGAASAIKLNDGLFAVPTEGAERGKLQQFFSAVRGSEVCGPELTPDSRTLFLAIQHPGEGGTFEKPISTWPDRQGMPRPSVITIQGLDTNKKIGS